MLSEAEMCYLLRLRKAFIHSGSSAALRSNKIRIGVMFHSKYFARFLNYFKIAFNKKKVDVQCFLKKEKTGKYVL